MGHTGKDLGVDLYALEQVAKSDLPTVSSAYDDAIGKCKGAQKGIDGMSNLPEQFVGEGGSVFHAYGQLNDAMAKVLKETKDNLDDTGKSLHDAAKLYADNDQAASNEFSRLMDDRGEPKPE